jgi:hypothetical protein
MSNACEESSQFPQLPKLPILSSLKPTHTYSTPSLNSSRNTNPRLPSVLSAQHNENDRKSSLRKITDSLEARINAILPIDSRVKNVKFQSEPARQKRLAPTLAQRIRVNERIQDAAEAQKVEAGYIDSAHITSAEKLVYAFKSLWRNRSRGKRGIHILDITGMVEVLSSDLSLAQLSLKELDQIANIEVEIYETRKAAIDGLEEDLENSEIERINNIGESLLDLGIQGAQIRFESPSLASRMVQEESLSVNFASIENRRKIIEYTVTFRAMNYELHRNFEKSFKISVEKWRGVRFSHVNGIYIYFYHR